MWIVELAAIRQKYVCQSQSLNLFVPKDITMEEMSDIHVKAWASGVKSLYYCRTKGVAKASVGVGGKLPLNSVPVRKTIVYDECKACEG